MILPFKIIESWTTWVIVSFHNYGIIYNKNVLLKWPFLSALQYQVFTNVPILRKINKYVHRMILPSRNTRSIPTWMILPFIIMGSPTKILDNPSFGNYGINYISLVNLPLRITISIGLANILDDPSFQNYKINSTTHILNDP